MSDADTPPASDRRILLEAVGVGVVGLVVGLLLTLVTGLALGVTGIRLPALAAVGLTLVLVQGVAFGGTALAYLRWRGFSIAYVGVGWPSLRDTALAVLGYVVSFGGALAGAVIVSTTGVEAGRNQLADIAVDNPEVLLLLIPAAFVFIGPGEELLFRGVVQNRLREAFGPAPAVVLAGVLFAAIHFVALTGSPSARLVTVTLLFVPSLTFGAVYELSGNIVVPAVVHAAYDATLFVLLYVALSYSLAPGLL